MHGHRAYSIVLSS